MTYSDREERNAYHRRWRADRRARGIALLGGRCAVCGTSENLEIDHPDRDKDPRLRKSGGALWTFSWARIEAELAKCQLLCESCHKEKTRSEAAKGEQKLLHAKMNEAAVRDIRSSPLTLRELATKYDIDYSAVWKIKTGKRWGHVR